MNNKSSNRIRQIVKNISTLKLCSTKKYQVRGYYEYKQIAKIIDSGYPNIKYKLEYSETQHTNKLKSINMYIDPKYKYGGFTEYISEQNKCMYIVVTKPKL